MLFEGCLALLGGHQGLLVQMDISGLVFDMLIFHIKFMMKFLYLFVKDSHNLGVLLFASLNFQFTFLFFVVDSRQLCL